MSFGPVIKWGRGREQEKGKLGKIRFFERKKKCIKAEKEKVRLVLGEDLGMEKITS